MQYFHWQLAKQQRQSVPLSYLYWKSLGYPGRRITNRNNPICAHVTQGNQSQYSASVCSLARIFANLKEP
jgi:hypothetical protein